MILYKFWYTRYAYIQFYYYSDGPPMPLVTNKRFAIANFFFAYNILPSLPITNQYDQSLDKIR